MDCFGGNDPIFNSIRPACGECFAEFSLALGRSGNAFYTDQFESKEFSTRCFCSYGRSHRISKFSTILWNINPTNQPSTFILIFRHKSSVALYFTTHKEETLLDNTRQNPSWYLLAPWNSLPLLLSSASVLFLPRHLFHRRWRGAYLSFAVFFLNYSMNLSSSLGIECSTLWRDLFIQWCERDIPVVNTFWFYIWILLDRQI